MNLFNISLVIHITGIVMIAGFTFSAYFISRRFWIYIEADRNKAIIINSASLIFARVVSIGGAITILSGITMVLALHGAFVSQTWFRVKMLLVLFIIINASVFAGRQNKKLQRSLSEDNAFTSLVHIKVRMNTYYVVQFILLLAIFILSVFRFQ